jgi:hypothetical protein
MANSMRNVAPDPSEALPDAERAWLLHSEGLWRQAHAIVSRQPDLDAGDVYHALRNLELPPAERLRRGLTRVRVRPHAR